MFGGYGASTIIMVAFTNFPLAAQYNYLVQTVNTAAIIPDSSCFAHITTTYNVKRPQTANDDEEDTNTAAAIQSAANNRSSYINI